MEGASGAFTAGRGPIGPIGGFLERFRRTGGVPAAVGDEVLTELAPVFAALDEIERQVAELRERARETGARHAREAEEEVEMLIAEAEEEVEMLIAEARSRAESEREDAYLTGVREADVEATRIVEAAQRDADAIVGDGRERMQRLVDAALARVLEAGT